MSAAAFYRVCACSLYNHQPHPVTSRAEWERHLIIQEQDRLRELFEDSSEEGVDHIGDGDTSSEGEMRGGRDESSAGDRHDSISSSTNETKSQADGSSPGELALSDNSTSSPGSASHRRPQFGNQRGYETEESLSPQLEIAASSVGLRMSLDRETSAEIVDSRPRGISPPPRRILRLEPPSRDRSVCCEP